MNTSKRIVILPRVCVASVILQLISLYFFSPPRIFADSHLEEDLPYVNVSETIFVTATRVESQTNRIAENTVVLTAKDIERLPARDLGELLTYVPGVDIQVNSQFGQSTSLSINGSDSRHVLVMVDGIPFNTQLSGQANPTRIPVGHIDRVEIIKGAETGDRAVAKALDYVRQIRKTPIVVNDARFFYANRCIIPYLNEGARMVAEGVEPALVDNAARLLGMPVGPLQLMDETSIDLGVKIAKATKEALGDKYPAENKPVDDLIFGLYDAGRLGRKSNAGFFDYDEKGKRQGYWDGLDDLTPSLDDQPDVTEVQHRLMFAQVLEAVRALEEGVLEDIREGDVGAILAWGFAPWSGGPFSWLDIIGAPYAAERCDQLTEKSGPRFTTPDLLRELAEKNQTFYARFGTSEDQAA